MRQEPNKPAQCRAQPVQASPCQRFRVHRAWRLNRVKHAASRASVVDEIGVSVARARIEASAVIDLNVASVWIEQSGQSVLSVLSVRNEQTGLSVANEAIAGIEPKREENVTNVASARIDQNGATEVNGQNATSVETEQNVTSVETEQSATSEETVWSAGVATITTTRTRMHRKLRSSGQTPLQQQMTLPWSLILD